jgi:hypothetical protein
MRGEGPATISPENGLSSFLVLRVCRHVTRQVTQMILRVLTGHAFQPPHNAVQTRMEGSGV